MNSVMPRYRFSAYSKLLVNTKLSKNFNSYKAGAPIISVTYVNNAQLFNISNYENINGITEDNRNNSMIIFHLI